MGVDVTHLLGPDTGIGNRVQHDPVSAVTVLRRQSDVEGIAAHAVPNQFRDDLRAALPREFKFFEHQYAGALAHDKTVAILVEGAGCPLRFFVACGKSTHCGKSADSHGSNGSFRAPADHDVCVAP